MEVFRDIAVVSPLADLLIDAVNKVPDQDAIVFPQSRATYQELFDGALTFAKGLLALGVKKGDHVGLFTTNSIEFVQAFFGISLVGGVVVPLNARHKTKELTYIINNADLVALFTTSDPEEYVNFGALVLEALPAMRQVGPNGQLHVPDAPKLKNIVLLKGNANSLLMSRAEFNNLSSSVADVDVDQRRLQVSLRSAALILYTSGTTANPKGCMLSHEAIVRGPVFRASTRFHSKARNVHWGAGPLFHIGSLAPLVGAIGVHGTYVTDEYFEPGRALALIEREKVTTAFPWFQAIVQSMLDHPDFKADSFQSILFMMLIGPRKLVERVQSVAPNTEVLQGCGMTETAGIFGLSDLEDSQEERCLRQGRAVPGIEVRIIDPETGKDAEVNKVGEIWVRGYCVMNGYYNDPEKTAETLDSEGWLRTGDLYSRSETGALCFNGRLKDMLKVGGENVAAIEIEAFLCEHPSVKLAEVVGKPDPRLDEVPVAFVELRPGCSANEEELIEFCKGKISSYKIPRAVHFMRADQWPMSATKVNKRALRAMLEHQQ